MPREFSRSRRLEEAIQRILGEVIAGKARDPRLAGLTITDVRVSRDLSVAKVFYAVLTPRPTPGADVEQALRAAAGFLRSTLAGELRVRRVPELRFLRDEGLLRAQEIGDLIERAVRDDAVAGSAETSVEPKA